jgi:hypothetical protein
MQWQRVLGFDEACRTLGSDWRDGGRNSMTIQGLGRTAWVCAAIALAGFGCKTEPADTGGAAGVAPLQSGGMAAPGGTGGGVGAAGTTAGTGTGPGGTGAAGMATGAGTGAAGMTAAAGTGGMTAAGTGGMTAAGAGGMTAGGAGGAGGGDPVATCIANAAAMGRTGACTECGCMKCLAEINNCQDEPCASVVACGQMNGCRGRDCFCGAGRNALDCALMGAQGVCMNEIAAAAGICPGEPMTCATDLSAITNPTSNVYDAMNPVSRANQVSICTRGQVADEGVPIAGIPATPAIAGMCETECMQ